MLRAPPGDLAPRAGVSSKKVRWNGQSAASVRVRIVWETYASHCSWRVIVELFILRKFWETLDNELQANVVRITVAMPAMGLEVWKLKLLKFEVIEVIEV